jgi:hypothetical protein
MERLREITAEYESRLSTEAALEQLRLGPNAKVAQVIYSTGVQVAVCSVQAACW